MQRHPSRQDLGRDPVGFFATGLREADPALAAAIDREIDRQRHKIELIASKGLTGDIAERSRGRAHVTCDKNGVPFDPRKPTVTSGVRLATPPGTTRGFGVAEFREVGRMISEVLDGLAAHGETGNADVEEAVKSQAIRLCARFPIY